MKNVVLCAGLLSWLLTGCGKSSAGPEQTLSASGQSAVPAAASQAQVTVALPVDASSTPQDVVLAFLNGMRDGNSDVTAALLTQRAQEETVKHNWPVQPPGAPSATYQLGDLQYADQSQSTVHVPCVWSEPDGNGGIMQFEVVWALSKQPQGWRVAGFATEVIPGRAPYFFNFEDIAALKATQAQAEAALTEVMSGQAAEVAEVPASENVLR